MDKSSLLITICTITLPAITALIGTIVATKQTAKRHELNLMRLQVLTTELSVSIRLGIYDEYKQKGGNSWLDEYVETILKPMAKGQFVERNRRAEDNK